MSLTTKEEIRLMEWCEEAAAKGRAWDYYVNTHATVALETELSLDEVKKRVVFASASELDSTYYVNLSATRDRLAELRKPELTDVQKQKALCWMLEHKGEEFWDYTRTLDQIARFAGVEILGVLGDWEDDLGLIRSLKKDRNCLQIDTAKVLECLATFDPSDTPNHAYPVGTYRCNPM